MPADLPLFFRCTNKFKNDFGMWPIAREDMPRFVAACAAYQEKRRKAEEYKEAYYAFWAQRESESPHAKAAATEAKLAKVIQKAAKVKRKESSAAKEKRVRDLEKLIEKQKRAEAKAKAECQEAAAKGLELYKKDMEKWNKNRLKHGFEA